MNEISKEKIEIGEVEYTLFLNRKGLVAWEKFCKEELNQVEALQTKYEGLTDIINDEKEVELQDDTNPFEGMEDIDDVSEDNKVITVAFKKLYWIMLYTEHKLLVSEAEKLYDEACTEYGEGQLIKLAKQMIEDMNTNTIQKAELKNLKALRQK